LGKAHEFQALGDAQFTGGLLKNGVRVKKKTRGKGEERTDASRLVQRKEKEGGPPESKLEQKCAAEVPRVLFTTEPKSRGRGGKR